MVPSEWLGASPRSLFESAGTDSTGASLVAVYSKIPALTPSEVLEDRTAEVAALMKARAVGPR